MKKNKIKIIITLLIVLNAIFIWFTWNMYKQRTIMYNYVVLELMMSANRVSVTYDSLIDQLERREDDIKYTYELSNQLYIEEMDFLDKLDAFTRIDPTNSLDSSTNSYIRKTWDSDSFEYDVANNNDLEKHLHLLQKRRDVCKKYSLIRVELLENFYEKRFKDSELFIHVYSVKDNNLLVSKYIDMARELFGEQ
jgi:hypothetical protein